MARKAAAGRPNIETLIDGFRHQDVTQDEMYEELAARLDDDQEFCRAFSKALVEDGGEGLGALRSFYEDYQAGAYSDLGEGDEG
ncbi:MAG: hypothetical protein ACYS22_00975 [Planctomycetota bacterium]|jgi:hypothetical protein